MRLTLEVVIINGDDTFDPRAFNGLSKRLVPGEAQTIDSVVSYGGDKVLIGSNAGAAALQHLEQRLDRLDHLVLLIAQLLAGSILPPTSSPSRSP